MTSINNHHAAQAPLAFLSGGGEMAERVRTFDWSNNPVGPVAEWPQSLKTAVSICLTSRFPIVLWWGPDLRLLYNDAWRPVLGQTKHPQALGSPGRDIWPEIWHIIGPMLEGVLATGQATWSDDQLLPLDRNGYLEEAYFTYSYSPIRDEGGKVGGVFSAVSETTLRVIGERRLRTLRELAAQASTAKTPDEAGRAALQTFAANPADVPFALLYFLDDNRKYARLCGCTPMTADTPASPKEIDLTAGGGAGWPVADVVKSGQSRVVDDVAARFGAMPRGPLPVDPEQAIVLPLRSAAQDRVAGVLVMGVNPCRALDDEHRSFFALAAGHVATAVANARAYEEERKRAEALAELDRAKTAFFSNVSHEFRTPLTLMLGPVEELLAKSHTDLPPAAAGQLEVVNRNGLRLLRLVNTLLDFSRIEAGRVRAVYQPTDLAAFTADLASVFRSACERAGLRLVVDCPPLPEPVFVDREMWEKVVLNLLSNAFKFTFDGEIGVSLRQKGDAAELRVRDTGTGIPAEEMPRLFERFHRVENARGRTHEGSGIGLALVQELVKLHGGSVTAESVIGQGTTFAVSVPLGSAHLPPDRIAESRNLASTVTGASPYVEEALRWLPDDGRADVEARSELPTYREVLPTPHRPPVPDGDDERPRVLVADDNADMRQYVARLLAEQYRVETVPDGEAALQAARERPPDLILTDVMMPRLDGFGLLRGLRAEPRTRGLPVIMLSARAGEESRVEGMEAGADDYLVKPFSARELLARVSAHLQMARLRREASETLRASEERFQSFMNHSPATAYIKDAEGRFLYVNRLLEDTFHRPMAEWIGKTDFDFFPPEEAAQYRQNDLSVLASHTTAQFVEAATQEDGLHYYLSFKFPLQARDGRWLLAGMSLDITEQRQAEQALRESEARLRNMFEQTTVGIAQVDLTGRFVLVNQRFCEITGYSAEDLREKTCAGITHPDDQACDRSMFEKALAERRPYVIEKRYVRKDGSPVWVQNSVSEINDGDGGPKYMLAVSVDITDRKRAEVALRKHGERFRLLWESAAVLLSTEEPEAMLRGLFAKIGPHLQLDAYFNFAVDETGQALRLVSCVGVPEETARRISRLEFGQAVCGTVALCRQPVMATYIQQSDDPKTQLVKSFGIRVYACNPLIAKGRLLGTLSFASRSRDEFDPDELEFLQTVSHYVTVAYERLRLVEELRDTDRRKDQFLATLAHELRNPLAPLRNGLQVMKLARNNGEAVEQARAMMERQLGQMVRLIDDLLDVSRISRGRITLKKERVELAKVVQSAVETSRPLIEASGHDLTIHVPPQPIYVDADVTRLAQVFANLLNNAAKFTDRGGRITLTVEQEGSDAVVSVRDTGVGIPAPMLPKVFDMFTQVDRSLERAQGGLGIGLSLVKGLVDLHGGSVEARSEGYGMGSEFVVRLPVVLSLHDEQPRDDAEEVGPVARRRVLVVDDNRDAAASLAMMLKLMGSEVRTAHDGLEAVEAAAAFRPDVVLLDIGMPKLNGYDACRRIREKAWGKSAVVVALTGWGQEEDKRRSQEAGFNGHLVKPVEPAALEKLLAELKAETG